MPDVAGSELSGSATTNSDGTFLVRGSKMASGPLSDALAPISAPLLTIWHKCCANGEKHCEEPQKSVLATRGGGLDVAFAMSSMAGDGIYGKMFFEAGKVELAKQNFVK